jgi:hypothetical protein
VGAGEVQGGAEGGQGEVTGEGQRGAAWREAEEVRELTGVCQGGEEQGGARRPGSGTGGRKSGRARREPGGGPGRGQEESNGGQIECGPEGDQGRAREKPGWRPGGRREERTGGAREAGGGS